MNSYINAQIMNMIAMTKTFEQGCEMAAMKDDGTLSKDEAKTLKQIKAVCQKFRSELEKAK